MITIVSYMITKSQKKICLLYMTCCKIVSQPKVKEPSLIGYFDERKIQKSVYLQKSTIIATYN